MKYSVNLLFGILLANYITFAQEYPDQSFPNQRLDGIWGINYNDDIVFHPKNPDSVILLCFGGEYITADGGDTWEGLNYNDLNIWDMAYHPEYPDSAYLVNESGVYRTSDGGNSWTHTASMTLHTVSDFFLDPSDPSCLWMSHQYGTTETEKGLWLSENKGENWTKVLNTADVLRVGTGNAVGVIQRLENDSSRLLVSTDRFQHIDTLSMWFPPYDYVYDVDGITIIDSVGQPCDVRDILLDYYEQDIILVTNGSSIFKSSNRGASWERSFNGGSRLIADPAHAGTLYMLSEYSTYRSTDYGDSWNLDYTTDVISFNMGVSPSNGEVWNASIHEIFKRNTSNQWSQLPKTGITSLEIKNILTWNNGQEIIAVSHLLHYSDDGGETWVERVPYATSSTLRATIEQLKTNADQSVFIFAGIINDEGTLFKSTDKGQSWQNITPHTGDGWEGMPFADCRSLAIDPNNDDIVYASDWSSDSILFKSTDGGIHWEGIVKDSLPFTSITDIEIDPNNSQRVYVVDQSQSGIYMTEDGGLNWIHCFAAAEAESYNNLMINPYNPNEVLAGNTWAGSIARTTDAGASWQIIDMPFELTGEIHFDTLNNTMVYYAGMTGDVHRSLDTMKTWQNLTNNGLYQRTTPPVFSFWQSGSHFLLGSINKGLFEGWELAIDTLQYTEAVNCVYDSTAGITIEPRRPTPGAFYSIHEGTDLQADNTFEDLPQGSYFPVMIFGDDTLSKGAITITSRQSFFVDLGEDQTISEQGSITLDACGGTGSYFWSNDAATCNIVLDGADLPIDDNTVWLRYTDEYDCVSSDTVTITVTEETGISDIPGLGMLLYPNPAQEKISLRINDPKAVERIWLINLQGQTVFTTEQVEAHTSINLSNLNRGVYLLYVRSNNKTYKAKIFKE